MVVDAGTLQMLRLRLDVAQMLRSVGLNVRPYEDLDLGYLVHWQLVSLFGDAAPRTFAIRDQRGAWVEVLGYVGSSARNLGAVGHGEADPACDWTSVATKALPRTWRPGARFQFEARVCPVVRRAKDGPQHRRGAEVDAFLAACDLAGNTRVDRMSVYGDWLARQIEREGAARLVRFEPGAFRRVRLHRRTQGVERVGRAIERPEFLARGAVEVVNGVAFTALLRRGIGRHRAFGFGMLLLKPGE